MATNRNNTSKTNTKPEARQSRAPSHIVFFAPEREGAPWTRIGAMWPTQKGNGFRQALDFIPNGPGSIVVLPNDNNGNEETGQ